MNIYYISDIHVEHHINWKTIETEEHLRNATTNLAANFFEEDYRKPEDYLLIAGDTCESTYVGKLFFEAVTRFWNPQHIIVILGNHEYWVAQQSLDFIEKKTNPTVDAIVKKWRLTFRSLGIIFLQNECFDIPDVPITILGGTGFSGLNTHYNASAELYLNVVKTPRQDKAQSRKFDRIYQKAVEDTKTNGRQLIVLTHNPYEDWCRDNLQSDGSEPVAKGGIIFISGHTHKNINRCVFCKDVGQNSYFFADAQVGYGLDGLKIQPKHIHAAPLLE